MSFSTQGVTDFKPTITSSFAQNVILVGPQNLVYNIHLSHNCVCKWSMKARYPYPHPHLTSHHSPLLHLKIAACISGKMSIVLTGLCSEKRDFKDQGQSTQFSAKASQAPLVPLTLFWIISSLDSAPPASQVSHCGTPGETCPTSWPCSLGADLPSELAPGVPRYYFC